MWFEQKKIPPIGFVQQTKDVVISTVQKTALWLFLLCLVGWVLFASGFFDSTFQTIDSIGKTFVTNTSQTLSSTFGKEMIKDEYGNINILLVWYGWEDHAGWYLADSIVVASYDTKLHSASLISLPRDLIVNMSGYINKINAAMAYKYNKTRDLEDSALALAQKVWDITSLNIPYYALIDFNGFAKLIDSIWWIDITVPKRIYDNAYPGPNWTYTVFSLNSWFQHLDWQTALKYARSRHSTSDFSRSQRQQQIIKAIMSRVADWGMFSISTVKKLYSTYKEMVTTNVQMDELIGLLRYGKTIPLLHSFGYTMECSNDIRRTMQAACLLYPVNSEDFNGMSWLLPVGASMGKLSFYDYTRYFADMVAHNQWYLNEALPIHIYNATDTNYAKKFAYRNGISGKLAAKLRRYAFMVHSVDNASYASTGTTAVIYATWSYEETLRMVKLYVNIDTIDVRPLQVDGSGVVLPSSFHLYLGNNYLDQVWSKPFSYYK